MANTEDIERNIKPLANNGKSENNVNKSEDTEGLANNCEIFNSEYNNTTQNTARESKNTKSLSDKANLDAENTIEPKVTNDKKKKERTHLESVYNINQTPTENEVDRQLNVNDTVCW